MFEEINQLKPTEQLDIVLDCLFEGDGALPCVNLLQVLDLLERNKHITVKNGRDVEFILRQLVIDGSASCDPDLVRGMMVNDNKLSDMKTPFYFITFSGKVFRQKGGYRQAFEDTKSQRNRARVNECVLRWGGCWCCNRHNRSFDC